MMLYGLVYLIPCVVLILLVGLIHLFYNYYRVKSVREYYSSEEPTDEEVDAYYRHCMGLKVKMKKKVTSVFVITLIISFSVLYLSQESFDHHGGYHYDGPALRIEYDWDRTNDTRLYDFFHNESYNDTFRLRSWNTNETIFHRCSFTLYNAEGQLTWANGVVRRNPTNITITFEPLGTSNPDVLNKYYDSLEMLRLDVNETYQKDLNILQSDCERFIEAFVSEFGDPNEFEYYMNHSLWV